MDIACVQFAPQNDIETNIVLANYLVSSLVNKVQKKVRLIILPASAFYGCHVRLIEEQFKEYMERTLSWTQRTARDNKCVVLVGYLKFTHGSEMKQLCPASIGLDANGDKVVNYRHHGFLKTAITVEEKFCIPRVIMGISTDLAHPEFPDRILASRSNLVILHMEKAQKGPLDEWRERLDRPYAVLTQRLEYLAPVIKAKTTYKITVVFASLSGVEDESRYHGTSAVVGICNGNVLIYGALGRHETAALLADPDAPQEKLFWDGTTADVNHPGDYFSKTRNGKRGLPVPEAKASISTDPRLESPRGRGLSDASEGSRSNNAQPEQTPLRLRGKST